MPKDPSFVRLADRLSGTGVFDLDTGWAITGADVLPFPDAEKTPMAAQFVRNALRHNKLEEASRAEYEEVHDESHLEQFSRGQLQVDDDGSVVVNRATVYEGDVRAVSDEARDRIRERHPDVDDPAAAQEKYELEQRVAELEEALERAQAAAGDGEVLDYESATVAQLREEAKSRGLKASGGRDALIERLSAADDGDEEEEEDEGE